MGRAVTHPLKASETALHMSVWRYLRYALPPECRAFHPANGGHRTKAAGGQLKAMGVVPGVPDFILILPNAQVAGIELKVGSNDLTDEQLEWRDWMVGRGCGFAVCRSLEEVETTITRWLNAFGLTPRARTIGRAA
jgi:hypothetical protein